MIRSIRCSPPEEGRALVFRVVIADGQSTAAIGRPSRRLGRTLMNSLVKSVLCSLGGPVFSGQLFNCYIMPRTAGSGTRRRPLVGSGSRVLSGDVEYCSGIRCIGQRLFGRVRGWGRRCG